MSQMPAGKCGTLFLRIPAVDWASVRCGAKTEVRYLLGGKGSLTAEALRRAPCPAVAYSTKYRGDNSTTMIVIERGWREPLGAITAESTRNEGFGSTKEFKQYWLLRRDAETPAKVKPVFSPLKDVNVVKFRLMAQADYEWAGNYLLHRLYGEYL